MRAPSELSPAARAAFATVAALAVGAVVLSGSTPPPLGAWQWWLAVPAVALLTRWRVEFTSGASRLELGFEFVLAVFLAYAVPQHAVVLYSAGWVLTFVRLRWQTAHAAATAAWIRLFNISLSILAGAATVTVVTHSPNVGRSGPWPLLACALGATAYFAVDYALSVLAMPLLGRSSLREAWWYDDLGVTLASQCGVAALGYLAAVVYHADAWALPLMLVPVATLVVAARGFVRSQRQRARATALFDLATGLHEATQADQVRATALAGVRDALGLERAWIADVDPDVDPDVGPDVGRDVGLDVAPDVGRGPAPVHVLVQSQPDRWLVVGPRRNGQLLDADDLRTLELIGSLTADNLRRLHLRDQLEHLAARDPLTGLLNRASLTAALVAHLSAGVPVALLFCDLDGFKSVNDRLGHDAGDRLLQIVSGRLSGCVGDHDLVGRWGGDEFVVLLASADAADAEVVGRRLLAAVAEPVPLRTDVARVGVSIGLAVSVPGGLDEADLLLGRADQAMYLAKAAGRGGLVVSQPVA